VGASERDEAARAAWRDEVAGWAPDDVVVLDEMGANVGLTPTYARAPRGARAYSTAPFNKGTNHTTLAVLTTAGLAAAMTVTGAADTLTVEAFVRELVVPLLRPGQTLVLDNVATHKGGTLRRLVEGAGCQLRFLPTYSPDLSPIEEAFAQLKALLRRAKARTSAALEVAIGDALSAVTPRQGAHQRGAGGRHRRRAQRRHAAPSPPLLHALRLWDRYITLRNAVKGSGELALLPRLFEPAECPQSPRPVTSSRKWDRMLRAWAMGEVRCDSFFCMVLQAWASLPSAKPCQE